MAVIPKLPGIEMTVTEAGKTLEEYRCEDANNEFATSRVIESSTMEAIILKIVIKAGYQLQQGSIVFMITVDGESVRSPTILKEKLKAERESAVKMEISNRLASTEAGQVRKIKVCIFGYVLQDNKVKQRDPLGSIQFAFRKINGVDDPTSFKMMLANFQTAIPTLSLSYWSSVEVGQLLRHLKEVGGETGIGKQSVSGHAANVGQPVPETPSNPRRTGQPLTPQSIEINNGRKRRHDPEENGEVEKKPSIKKTKLELEFGGLGMVDLTSDD